MDDNPRLTKIHLTILLSVAALFMLIDGVYPFLDPWIAPLFTLFLTTLLVSRWRTRMRPEEWKIAALLMLLLCAILALPAVAPLFGARARWTTLLYRILLIALFPIGYWVAVSRLGYTRPKFTPRRTALVLALAVAAAASLYGMTRLRSLWGIAAGFALLFSVLALLRSILHSPSRQSRA